LKKKRQLENVKELRDWLFNRIFLMLRLRQSL
jgi:hypothetical protein